MLQVPFKIARPFAAPPALPADKAAILKTAFMKTHQDPQYLEEAKKMSLDVSPLSGEEVVKLIADAEALPKALIARYQDILKVD